MTIIQIFANLIIGGVIGFIAASYHSKYSRNKTGDKIINAMIKKGFIENEGELNICIMMCMARHNDQLEKIINQYIEKNPRQ